MRFSAVLLSSLFMLVSVRGALAQGRAPLPGAWLVGCWEYHKGDMLIEERWMPARGGVMLEIGRTTRGDGLLDYEFVVLHLEPGKAGYEAHPAGQPPETFPARSITDSSFLFEDLAHDFPQRVGYTRRGADSVLAWIEGTAGGKTQRVEFPYARVKCE